MDKKITILIVDDQPSNLRFLARLLQKQGYRVRRAISGELALNAAFAVPPDLILLDILMPEINGYEVCEKLKRDERTQDIPVIFISVIDRADEKVRAFEVGGVDYITKPFQANEVLARIHHQLTIRQLQQQLETQNTQLKAEIQQRTLAQKETQLLLELSRSFARCPDFATALAETLHRVGRTIDAVYAEVWIEADATSLQCAQTWSATTPNPFIRAAADRVAIALPKTQGLIGRVWEKCQPECWQDSEELASFIASHPYLSREVHFQSGLVVPVALANPTETPPRDDFHAEKPNNALAILVFFSTDTTYDCHWCELVIAIAAQLGAMVQQKQAEANRRISEEKFTKAFRSSPHAIAIKTFPEGRYLDANESFFELLGYTPQEIIGSRSPELGIWLDAQRRDRFLRQLEAQNGSIRNLEVEFRTKSGQIKTLLLSAELIDLQGQKCVTLVTNDISDRKRAEEALRESANREVAISTIIERMRSTLEIESIFNITTRELRRVLSCDRVIICRFNPDGSGEVVAENVGKKWNSLIDRDKAIATAPNPYSFQAFYKILILEYPDLQSTLEETSPPKTRYFGVEDIYTRGLEPYDEEMLEICQARAYLAVPILSAVREQGEKEATSKPKLWGLLAAYQNSIPRHWQEEEINIAVQIGTQMGIALQQAELLARTQQQAEALKIAKEAADSANRAKSEFLANMSHELRTPLNAILGFTQLMVRDENLEREQQENLDIINRSGEHLLALINDILEMSKIEAGRAKFNEDTFNLYRLLDSLEDMFRLKARNKNIELICDRDRDLPQYILTDLQKLRQVLINLLGNAIKFTDRGFVRLSVTSPTTNNKRCDPASDGAYKLWRKPPETASSQDASGQTPRRRKTQAVRPRDDESGQTPRRRQTQGNADQDSRKGTRTKRGNADQERERAPRHQQTTNNSNPPPNPKPQPPPKKGRAIEGEQQKTLHFEVEDTGCGIAAEEIKTIFEAFGQTKQGTQFSEGTGLGLPISLQFTRLMGGELNLLSEVGGGSKFFFEIPIRITQEYAPETIPLPKRPIKAIAPDASEEMYRILVVEDRQNNRLLLVNLLGALGFDVKTAANGVEAIAVWESWHPHLIWMDLQMPVMDGYEATQQIRDRESEQNQQQTARKPVPIIALSASAFAEDRQNALAAGCNDFLSKPFQEEELLDKMEQYIGVQYTYERTKNSQNDLRESESSSLIRENQEVTEVLPLKPSALQVMPDRWRKKLYEASVQCSDRLIHEAIAQIPEEHSNLEMALTNLVEEFRFDILMELAQQDIQP
ncbi:MAG: response regulator [Cyanobacteria bacterium P01_E01_bin.42]